MYGNGTVSTSMYSNANILYSTYSIYVYKITILQHLKTFPQAPIPGSLGGLKLPDFRGISNFADFSHVVFTLSLCILAFSLI